MSALVMAILGCPYQVKGLDMTSIKTHVKGTWELRQSGISEPKISSRTNIFSTFTTKHATSAAIICNIEKPQLMKLNIIVGSGNGQVKMLNLYKTDTDEMSMADDSWM